MPPPQSSDPLVHGSQAEMLRLMDQFDRAWRNGTVPSIEELIAVAHDAGTDQRKLIEELIKIDLEYRWRLPSGRADQPATPIRDPLGERPLLDKYVARYPQLGGLQQLSAELIAWEYQVRQCWGDRPGPAEFAARFDRQAASLRTALAHVDSELAAERAPAVAHAANLPEAPTRAASIEPPRPVTTVGGLVSVIRDCQLLDPPQLDQLARQLVGKHSDPQGLARELVKRNWLTPYQVNQLLLGRGRDLTLGPYVLLERLGEGGAGQVYKARHRKMDRLVALKLIRKELLTDQEVIGRFYREIQVVSRLDHPNVVHAFDAGPVGTAHVLAMEYLDGTDLSRLVKQSGPLPIAQACDFIRQAACGLQHAHASGLVHRDIKPGNLFLTRGSGSGSAVVKVLDLGLARIRGNAAGEATEAFAGAGQARTLTPVNAAMMGTLDYLAPEQAVDFHGADIRADIYSLGCTFYCLLAGKPPFPEGTLAEKLLKHQQMQPPDIRHMRPDTPASLAAVLSKTLAKAPEKRYQTPAEVAAAVAPFCGAGGAAPVRLFSGQFAANFSSRRKVLAAIGGMSLASGLGFLLFGRRHAVSDSDGQFHELLRDLENPRLSSRYKTEAILRFRMAHPGTPQAQQAAEHYLRLDTPLDLLQRTQIPMALITPDLPAEAVAVPYPKMDASCIALSPDGAWVAVGEGPSVHLWNVSTRAEQLVWKAHDAKVQCLAFAPDGKLLASGGDDGTVKLWQGPAGKLVGVLAGHAGPVVKIALAPDGKVLAAGCSPKQSVTLWDTATREKRHTEKTASRVGSLAFSPDGAALAVTLLGPPEILILDGVTGRKRGQVALSPPGNLLLDAVAYTADGEQLVLTARESQGGHFLYDVAARPDAQATYKRRGSAGGHYLGWSLDGKTLVMVGLRTIRLEGSLAAKGQIFTNLSGPEAALAADGRHLVVAQNQSAPVYILRLAAKPL